MSQTRRTEEKNYIYVRNHTYYYVRNIPKRYRHRFANSRQIWRSLDTANYATAVQNVARHLLEYDAIVRGEVEYDPNKQVTRMDSAVRANDFGISFKTSAEIKAEPIEERILSLAERLKFVRMMENPTPLDVATLSGATEVPALTMGQAFKKFLEVMPEFTAGLNPTDARTKTRKYERSVEDFVTRMGDVDVLKLDKPAAKEYRLKLKTAVMEGDFKSDYANKHLGNLKLILEHVFDHDYEAKENPLAGLRIKIDDEGKREPFTEPEVEAIKNALPTCRLGEQARAIVKLGEITGAGQRELCWLTKTDIFLDAKIPYIRVSDNEFRSKVKGGGVRHRDLPIVDPAIVELLRTFPDGFTDYHDDKGPGRLYRHLQKFFSVVTPGKGHNSFRHRMDDLLKMSGVDLGLKASISGHALPGKLLWYGRGAKAYKLSDKKEAILQALVYAKRIEDEL